MFWFFFTCLSQAHPGAFHHLRSLLGDLQVLELLLGTFQTYQASKIPSAPFGASSWNGAIICVVSTDTQWRWSIYINLHYIWLVYRVRKVGKYTESLRNRLCFSASFNISSSKASSCPATHIVKNILLKNSQKQPTTNIFKNFLPASWKENSEI